MANRKVNKSYKFAEIQGGLALGFGGYLLFTSTKNISTLSFVTGLGLLILGVLEFIDLFRRRKNPVDFAFSLMFSGPEIVIAVLLLLNRAEGMAWPLILLAIYTIGRGVIEILNAFATIKDKNEKLMWAICGAVSIILGIVVLNSGNFADQTAFFRFFATALMAYGLTAGTTALYAEQSEKPAKANKSAKAKKSRK